MDVLSDVLKCLQLRSTVYFNAHFRAPWGMEITERKAAAFHYVTEGDCWLETGGRPPVQLQAGELIVFPHGSAHTLTDRPHGTALPADELIRPGSLEFGGNGPEQTTIVCGHFEYDMSGSHPLVASLPELLHTRASPGAEADWFTTAAKLAVLESERKKERPGATAVVERLAETLLIQVIRAHAEKNGRGFLAALMDDGIAAALEAIHRHPERNWTVERLGDVAAMSRSTFADRFRATVGMSPVGYLINWRMHRARVSLVSRNVPLREIARSIGYSDEFAFAKAFKRAFGETPASLRRRALAASPDHS